MAVEAAATDGAAAAAPAPPKYEVWKDCTPTGLKLPTLPGQAAPHMLQRYKDQDHSQDWLVTVENTHPNTLDPNASGFNRAVPRFFEDVSAVLIPCFRPGKLNTADFDFLDPNLYLLPHPRRSTLQDDPKIGTVLHAIDLVWLTNKDSKLPYDEVSGQMLNHPASVIDPLVTGMWVSRNADPSEADPGKDKRYAILFPFRPFKSASREPSLHCAELSQKENKEHFLDEASIMLRNIEATEIRAFGNNSNRSRSARAVVRL